MPLQDRSRGAGALRNIHWTKAARTYVNMFEGPVTGNIPEVLNRTNPSSAQVSASTCHSPWVTLKARPAPGPHQARTRPAPGPRQARARVFFGCDSI